MRVGIALIRILFSKMTIVDGGREGRVVSAGNQRSIYLRISFIFSSVGLLVGRGGKTERDMRQHVFVFIPFFFLFFFVLCVLRSISAANISPYYL